MGASIAVPAQTTSIVPHALTLGIDLGTSSLKIALLEPSGRVVRSDSKRYAVTSRRSGWSESDPRDWWEALVAAVQGLPRALRAEVRGIGLSGQMHGVVLTGSDGSPSRPAILWSDTRSASSLPTFAAAASRSLASHPNPVVAGMAGPTLLWLAEHDPTALENADHALQPKDWLRMRLTQVAATEPSDASATLLFDFVRGRWDENLLASLGLRAELLPRIVPSHRPAGFLEPKPAAILGLRSGIPVAAGAADAAAAALGGGLLRSGDAQLVVGTGAQIVVITDAPRPHVQRRTHVFRSALPGTYYSMAAMQNAGLALGWVKDRLRLSWSELYGSLSGLDARGERDVPVFLPYLSGERTPLLNAGARGAWADLGMNHDERDLARSALVGVCLAIRDGLDALAEAVPVPSHLRFAGGGSRDPGFAQLLADVLEKPLAPVDIPDASVVGAGLLGAVAAELRSMDDLVALRRDASPSVVPRPLSRPMLELRERFNELRGKVAP